MPIQHDLTYSDTLFESQRVNWRIEDIIGGDKTLDFTRPFLPESLVRTEPLAFLSAREKIVLNQIRAQGYLYLLGLFEEFILPFVMGHVRPSFERLDYRALALLQFASEEAKHIALFRRFRQEFIAGFGSDCQVIGPAEELSAAVLAHRPLGVALIILQVEWMAERHYRESLQDQPPLDPLFMSLLRHNWIEEAQHVKIDTLLIAEIAGSLAPPEIEDGIEDYLEIAGMLDDALKAQVRFDLESLAKSEGRVLTARESEEFLAQQLRAVRWTFLGCGMSHPSFLDTVEQLLAGAGPRLEEIALSMS